MRTLQRLNWRHVLPDLVIMVFAFYASLFIRLDFEGAKVFLPVAHQYLPLFVLIRFSTFVATGIYDIIWRYVSVMDATKIVRSSLFASLLILAASYLVEIGRLPRSTFLIDALLSTILLGGLRGLRRLAYEHSSEKVIRKEGRRAVIYGAGSHGRTLATRFQTDGSMGFNVIGFVDDDPGKVRRVISGVKVLGTRSELSYILRDYQIQELIIAMTRPPADLLRDIMQVSKSFQIRPRMMMSSSPNDKKHSRVDLFREIELSDLLNRPARHIDLESVQELVRNRRVLVTGAGGSIGSELARQILGFQPSKLLLLDHSEFNLYQIDHELRLSPSDTSLVVPLLADVKNSKTLNDIFAEHAPDIVFHAAAYKHVHLVEANPYSAIENNILGTKNLLEAAERAQVEAFVLISTDKAVNPAGVMGATKRVCELLVHEFGRRTKRRYTAVRFGNVLGSSGSLIPLLRKQIQNGEPVTVTHQDMTRYFMLIPEAVSLVLKASSIAEPGDITILRMGDPIKIVDIARNLITLMGRTEEEVPILYTGVRPGEKMFEELYLCGNELNTEHPDILVLPKGDSGLHNRDNFKLFETVESIVTKASNHDKEAIIELNSLVREVGMRSAEDAAAKPSTSRSHLTH